MHTARTLAHLCLLLLSTTAWSQLRLTEDFIYDAGDSLIARGWSTNQSTLTNAVLVTSPGLLYPDHPGSGLGNAAQLLPSGQDVTREFEPVTEGLLFVMLLVRVQSAASGDYVLHLQPSPQSTSYFCRLFIRQALNGNLAFGVAKRGTNASPTHVYSDSLFSTDATYCLVLKYRFTSGSSTDDEVSLFVFSGQPLPTWEPASATVGPVTDATNDASSLSVLALRQGDASHAPTLVVDGIRVCSTWDACLPVTLQSFAAVALPDLTVRLSWMTTTEVNCYGFTIQRSEGDPDALADIPGAFVRGQGTSLTPAWYSYVDTVPAAGTWYYRLRQSDLDGASRYSETAAVEIPTPVTDSPRHGFLLQPTYPNPFNAETVIRFDIPVRTHVSLNVYNALGVEMRQLVNGVLEVGTHALSLVAHDWPGGVYFCRLRAAGRERVTRIVLVR